MQDTQLPHLLAPEGKEKVGWVNGIAHRARGGIVQADTYRQLIACLLTEPWQRVGRDQIHGDEGEGAEEKEGDWERESVVIRGGSRICDRRTFRPIIDPRQ